MKNRELISRLTLAEKCSLLSGKDVWHTRPVERLGIPSVMLSDGPSGLRKQEGAGDQLGLNASVKATCMPSAATIACSWDEKLAEAAGSVIGSEARAQDVQVLLGPGLNTKRSPLCGRNFEYFSEDPYLAGKLAAAYVRGVQSQGVSACAKHFCANSQESHRMASNSVVDERTLRELYLTNFEIVVREAAPKAVMSAYNPVNSRYANENEHLLHDILRGEWGFRGAVITDWGGDNDFVEGVRAGCNLEMPGCGDDSPIMLLEAVKAGRISEEIIDRRVDELLTLILETAASADRHPADPEADHEIAARVAEQTAVLLRNEKSLLPLGNGDRVAFIGDFVKVPRFQGAGSSMVNAYRADDTLSLIKEYFPESVGFAPGFRRADEPDEQLARDAEILASKADSIVLYLGLTETFETEGLDRTHLRIPGNQIALLKRLRSINPRITVVLSAGSAVEMPWLEDCQALLYGGLNGQAGARAILKVLCGEITPSGKLAETFPATLESLPVTEYYPGAEYSAEYREGPFVGYRATESLHIPVTFPFGFGLSYTRFTYSELSISPDSVTFRLTNTGDVAGAEVSQLYVRLPGARILRPATELKGFAKTELAPGESRLVTIPLDDKAFRYFNVKTGRFEIEGGTYAIDIGASVQDIRLTGTVSVTGTSAPDPYAGLDVSPWQKGDLKQIPDNCFEALLGFPIPRHRWQRDKKLEMNDAILQMSYARNLIARFVGKRINAKIEKGLREGHPDLNLLFIYNMPFRGIGKMLNGLVSMRMAETILWMCNGHLRLIRGVAMLIAQYLNRPKLEKYLKKHKEQ